MKLEIVGLCRYNKKILCGIVKNKSNCPFQSSHHCLKHPNTVERMAGTDNEYGTLTLQRVRIDQSRIQMEILEKNICDECGVLWTSPIDKCPICSVME